METIPIFILLLIYILAVYRQIKVDVFRYELKEQNKEDILNKHLSGEMIIKFWKPLKEEAWKE